MKKSSNIKYLFSYILPFCVIPLFVVIIYTDYDSKFWQWINNFTNPVELTIGIVFLVFMGLIFGHKK